MARFRFSLLFTDIACLIGSCFFSLFIHLKADFRRTICRFFVVVVIRKGSRNGISTLTVNFISGAKVRSFAAVTGSFTFRFSLCSQDVHFDFHLHLLSAAVLNACPLINQIPAYLSIISVIIETHSHKLNQVSMVSITRAKLNDKLCTRRTEESCFAIGNDSV